METQNVGPLKGGDPNREPPNGAQGWEWGGAGGPIQTPPPLRSIMEEEEEEVTPPGGGSSSGETPRERLGRVSPQKALYVTPEKPYM